MYWKKNKKLSPAIVIFILFVKEVPDEERSRGIVITIPIEIVDGLKCKSAFPNRQTKLPSIILG